MEKHLLYAVRLLEHAAFLSLAFYLLLRLNFSTEYKKKETGIPGLAGRILLLSLLFGAFAAYSFSGNRFALDPSARAVSLAIISSGIILGPAVGFGAGLVAFLMHILGCTGTAPGLMALIVGCIAALLRRFRKGLFISPLLALFTGAGTGLLQYAVYKGLGHSSAILLPTVVDNILGVSVFSLIILGYEKLQEHERENARTEREVQVADSLQTTILPGIAFDMEENRTKDESFEWLIPHMKKIRLKKDEILFRRDDRADRLYLTIKGRVLLEEIGKTVGPGSMIGETGIFSPFQKRTASAVCTTDLETWSINRSELMTVLRTYPSGLFALIQLSLKRFIVNLTESMVQKQRIESELKIASTIQHSMLPADFPDTREYSLYASMKPARDVGGDFYDFFHIDENTLCMVIGDVSGKGVPASLFMVTALTLFRSIAPLAGTPEKTLARVNNALCQGNEECMFATVFCAFLNISTGTLFYANGGHNPPLLYRKGKRFGYMQPERGMLLGGMPGIKYVKEKTTLRTGDTLFLYTDGITEAMDRKNRMYGSERLKDQLNRLTGKKPEDTGKGVIRDVKSFVKKAPQSDDVTLLTLQFKAKKRSRKR